MNTEQIIKNIELRTFYRFLMVISAIIIITGIFLSFEDINLLYSITAITLGCLSLFVIQKFYQKVPYAEIN
jgi:hypothetical protein